MSRTNEEEVLDEPTSTNLGLNLGPGKPIDQNVGEGSRALLRAKFRKKGFLKSAGPAGPCLAVADHGDKYGVEVIGGDVVRCRRRVWELLPFSLRNSVSLPSFCSPICMRFVAVAGSVVGIGLGMTPLQVSVREHNCVRVLANDRGHGTAELCP
ncbi:hypothetical protein U1Q18_036805 [Sarracenia purpurea var. burkii]